MWVRMHARLNVGVGAHAHVHACVCGCGCACAHMHACVMCVCGGGAGRLNMYGLCFVLPICCSSEKPMCIASFTPKFTGI